MTAFVVNGNEVTFFGNATQNAAATSYVIHGVDNAQPGGGADAFSIRTARGYAATGTLTLGNVRVRE